MKRFSWVVIVSASFVALHGCKKQSVSSAAKGIDRVFPGNASEIPCVVNAGTVTCEGYIQNCEIRKPPHFEESFEALYPVIFSVVVDLGKGKGAVGFADYRDLPQKIETSRVEQNRAGTCYEVFAEYNGNRNNFTVKVCAPSNGAEQPKTLDTLAITEVKHGRIACDLVSFRGPDAPAPNNGMVQPERNNIGQPTGSGYGGTATPGSLDGTDINEEPVDQ
jgi:hypothetical protein